ncbi:hypothetical protein AB0D24_44550 [Streptomyces javensis]|uniref:hypothetical protein n=1 Tax=Streptomyces javensis TaxID=114698 RepID=UPI0033CD6CA4
MLIENGDTRRSSSGDCRPAAPRDRERPHKFPAPTDVKAAADAMGKWAQLYNDHPVTWCMWNEPSHNLTGRPDLASVRQTVDIYDAYASAMGPKGLFGLASFIPPNSKPKQQFGGRSYLEVAIDELRERRRRPSRSSVLARPVL